MSETIRERYGPYPKKKERKRSPAKEGPFLKRTYDWLKWKVVRSGGFSINQPCLDH